MLHCHWQVWVELCCYKHVMSLAHINSDTLGFLRRDDWVWQPGLPHWVVPLWLYGFTAQAQGQVVLPQVPAATQEEGPIVRWTHVKDNLVKTLMWMLSQAAIVIYLLSSIQFNALFFSKTSKSLQSYTIGSWIYDKR